MDSSQVSIGVVGAGRVGAVLAARLRAAGYRVVAVSGASAPSQLRIRTLLPGVPAVSPADVVDAADVVIVAVPDDVLESTMSALSTHVRPGQFVLHTSGRHGLAVLAAATAHGARPMALHPAMTFAGTDVDLHRTCVFGVTTGPNEREFATQLVYALGGTIEWVDEADRVRYHAALAHGANHLNTLVNQAMAQLRAAGIGDPAALLRPLLEASLDNSLAYGDAALTGPVARGDVETLRAHLAVLQPEVLAGYVAMARATAIRAAASGRIDSATFDDIQTVLADSLAEIAR